MYERYDETHEQRTFPFETYAAFLESAGFEQIEVTADFTNEAPQECAERYFISAKKPKPSFNGTMVFKPFSLVAKMFNF